MFGNDDDDAEYVESLGCQPAGVEQADFLLARGTFTIWPSEGTQVGSGGGRGGNDPTERGLGRETGGKGWKRYVYSMHAVTSNWG
jgi:hypothetical protein